MHPHIQNSIVCAPLCVKYRKRKYRYVNIVFLYILPRTFFVRTFVGNKYRSKKSKKIPFICLVCKSGWFCMQTSPPPPPPPPALQPRRQKIYTLNILFQKKEVEGVEAQRTRKSRVLTRTVFVQTDEIQRENIFADRTWSSWGF